MRAAPCRSSSNSEQTDPGGACAVKLEIVHATRYRYSGPIAETVMEVRLRPMDGNGQRCLEFELELSSKIKPRSYLDGYGNTVHYFNLVRPHSTSTVPSPSVIQHPLKRHA